MKLVSGKSEHNDNGKHTGGHVHSGGSAPKKDAAPRNSTPAKKKAPKEPKKKLSGGKKAIIIVCVVLAVLIAAFAGVGVYAGSIETVFPNVTFERVDLGGMTEAEAADALIAANVGTAEDETLEVSLPGDCSLSVSRKDAGVYVPAADAAVYVYNYCHGNGFFGNTIAFITDIFGGRELKMSDAGTLDEEYVQEQVKKAVQDVSLALMDNDVKINEDDISVIKGASGMTVDSDSLYTALVASLNDGAKTLSVDATVAGKSAEIDLQKLYDTVYTEPVNAYIDSKTGEVVEGVDGMSFDVAAAQSLWASAADGETVIIPLIKTAPEITGETLRSTMFSQLLSQKSTTLGGSSSARVNNITKAAAAIDGTVLNPGDEFSYNSTLGQRTTASGYQAAGAYSNGQVVSEVGGGICQVSSTLYYCVLIANLEVTERWCHYFGVSYLPAGLDATVSWPSPDFKFKNNSEYPVKIAAYIDKASYSVTVQIWGYNPDGIRVEMTTQSFTTANGFGATSYRTVYDKNGNVISKNKEATSEYHNHTAETPSPSPSASPSEEPTASAEPTTPAVSTPVTVEPVPTPAPTPIPAPTTAPTTAPTPPPEVSVPPDAA